MGAGSSAPLASIRRTVLGVIAPSAAIGHVDSCDFNARLPTYAGVYAWEFEKTGEYACMSKASLYSTTAS
jgi:hypothetical protein